MDRTSVIFGNPIDKKTIKKAEVIDLIGVVAELLYEIRL